MAVSQEFEFGGDFADGFIGEAAGFLPKQFFHNFGFFCPGAELFLFFLFGVGFLMLKPVALDGEVFGIEIATAEASDIGTKLAEAVPLGAGVSIGGDRFGADGVLEQEPEKKFLGENGGWRCGGLVVGRRDACPTTAAGVVEGGEEVSGFKEEEPVAEAAVAPF